MADSRLRRAAGGLLAAAGGPWALDEAGLAEEAASALSGMLAWCPEREAFLLCFADDVWDQLDGDEASALLQDYLAARGELIADEPDPDRRAALAKANARFRSGSSIRSVCSLLRGQARRVPDADLDWDPEAVGTPEGVARLRSGELARDAARGWGASAEDPAALMVTRRTAAAPPPAREPDDPRWAEFVLEVCSGDRAKADYLQRCLGYSCLGGNPEEVMFVAFGPTTRNGKSTLMEAVSHAMGQYARAVPADFLTGRPREGGTDDVLASLVGVRLVTMSEPREGDRLNCERVKSLTGNDTQTTSRKYGHTFSFRPHFTMWMLCNRLPEVEDPTVIESGRLRVVTFERHFERWEQDQTLKAHFRTRRCASTIVRWLMAGYADYARRGLAEPEHLAGASAWAARSGGFSAFASDRLRFGSGLSAGVGELREAYAEWCAENDEERQGPSAVREYLASAGAVQRKAGGSRVWVGVGLADGTKTG